MVSGVSFSRLAVTRRLRGLGLCFISVVKLTNSSYLMSCAIRLRSREKRLATKTVFDFSKMKIQLEVDPRWILL